jgi:hypothetical protein
MKVHLVLYSNNEPFNTTKKLIIESVNKHTTKNVIIHDYTLEKIKTLSWFEKIKNLPSVVPISVRSGRRDGYYNAWKPFITKEVYDIMDDGDILYYMDCSKYIRRGFTQNIDKICDITDKLGFIAGSCGNTGPQNSPSCCSNMKIWNKIIPDNDNSIYLRLNHVLNAWFLLKKHESNNNFVNEWEYFTAYKDTEFKNPLVTYHHTVDQSIFNILIYKYNLKVFYIKLNGHDKNRDFNFVLSIINKSTNPDTLFSFPVDVK